MLISCPANSNGTRLRLENGKSVRSVKNTTRIVINDGTSTSNVQLSHSEPKSAPELINIYNSEFWHNTVEINVDSWTPEIPFEHVSLFELSKSRVDGVALIS